MALNHSAVEEIDVSKASLRETARKDGTSSGMQDPLLAIEEAAAREDRRALSSLAEKVDWRSRHPDDLIRAIQSC